MKEVSYDGAPLKEESMWEKRYAQNKAAQAPLLRTPNTENGVSQNNPPVPKRSMTEHVLKHKTPEQPLALYESHEEHEEMPLGKIIFVLLLVLAFGLGVGIYALIGTKITIPFWGDTNNTATTTLPKITSEDTDILLSDSPRAQVLADVAIAFGKTSLLEGGTRKVRFLVKGEAGVTRPVTTKEFFQAINKFPGGDTFVRSLDTPFVYEIGSDGILVGKITVISRSYPNTFAAMLDWESVIAQDLLLVLHPELTQNKIKEIEGRVFRDERIGDINARVLSDAMGNTLITYGFIGGKTLIITGAKGMLPQATSTTPTK